MVDLPAAVTLPDPRNPGKTRPEDYVWHFVMHRARQLPARGERLATLALRPEDVALYGRDGRPGDELAEGLRVIARALEAERREWVRRLNAAGYVDGYGVAVVAERGYQRSLFPGTQLAALPGTLAKSGDTPV